MKKSIFLFLSIILCGSIQSQSLVAIGNFIIEQNDFTIAREILIKSGYELFTSAELQSLGHNPKTKIIGTKSEIASKSIMGIVTAKSQNGGISSTEFLCFDNDVSNFDDDITDVGYKLFGSRKYIEAKRIKINEVSYRRIGDDYVDTVIIKYLLTKNGEGIQGANVKFSRTRRKLNN